MPMLRLNAQCAQDDWACRYSGVERNRALQCAVRGTPHVVAQRRASSGTLSLSGRRANRVRWAKGIGGHLGSSAACGATLAGSKNLEGRLPRRSVFVLPTACRTWYCKPPLPFPRESAFI